MRKIICISLMLVLFIPHTGYGMPAMEFLEKNIDNVLRILKDPQYQSEEQKEVQKREIWKIIRNTFDFTEIAKRALARNWKKFTPVERKEFTDAFAELLGNTYLTKITSGFKDEKVIYLSQKKISSTKIRVSTKIIRENGEIPVDYSMKQVKDEWKVYDLRVEGISLVKNYRSQFNRFLFKQSTKELIERLRKKIEQLKRKASAEQG